MVPIHNSLSNNIPILSATQFVMLIIMVKYCRSRKIQSHSPSLIPHRHRQTFPKCFSSPHPLRHPDNDPYEYDMSNLSPSLRADCILLKQHKYHPHAPSFPPQHPPHLHSHEHHQPQPLQYKPSHPPTSLLGPTKEQHSALPLNAHFPIHRKLFLHKQQRHDGLPRQEDR